MTVQMIVVLAAEAFFDFNNVVEVVVVCSGRAIYAVQLKNYLLLL